jgi:cholesterol transport system auxiliary component
MRRGPLWVGLLSLTISSASCALLTPSASETRKETLAKTPVELSCGQMHPGTLLVLTPEASAPYDTTRMAYEVRPYEIAYFSRTEWADRPPQMLHGLLVQTLQQAGCFSALVTPPFFGHYTYALRTEIRTLRQNFTVEPATLELSLRVQLSTEPGHRVVATTEISEREPMREKTPYAGAVAANDATAKALGELAEFVCFQAGAKTRAEMAVATSCATYHLYRESGVSAPRRHELR